MFHTGGMANTSARLCGGHLTVEFDTQPLAVDGLALVVSSRRMLWDGEPVSPVVAEALALAWHAAEDDEDDDHDS